MSSYPTIDMSQPLNEHDRLLTSFANEALSMKKLQEQHCDKAGNLRRVITDLRASLKSVMGEAIQINLPGQHKMCARLKTYNTAKAIRNDVIDTVLQETMGDITIGCDDWKNLLTLSVTAGVRARVGSTKQYVDVCPQKTPPADQTKVVPQASSDDVVARLGNELQRVQAELKKLQSNYKQRIEAPKQRIEELRKPVLDELSRRSGGVDKVRILTGGKSVFVAGKLSYRSVKLAIGRFQGILRDALNQCEDDCSMHEVRQIVLKCVNNFREMEQEKSERELVGLDRTRSKTSRE